MVSWDIFQLLQIIRVSTHYWVRNSLKGFIGLLRLLHQRFLFLNDLPPWWLLSRLHLKDVTLGYILYLYVFVYLLVLFLVAYSFLLLLELRLRSYFEYSISGRTGDDPVIIDTQIYVPALVNWCLFRWNSICILNIDSFLLHAWVHARAMGHVDTLVVCCILSTRVDGPLGVADRQSMSLNISFIPVVMKLLGSHVFHLHLSKVLHLILVLAFSLGATCHLLAVLMRTLATSVGTQVSEWTGFRTLLQWLHQLMNITRTSRIVKLVLYRSHPRNRLLSLSVVIRKCAWLLMFTCWQLILLLGFSFWQVRRIAFSKVLPLLPEIVLVQVIGVLLL